MEPKIVYKDPYMEIMTSDGSAPFTTGLTSIKVFSREPKLVAWSHEQKEAFNKLFTKELDDAPTTPSD